MKICLVGSILRQTVVTKTGEYSGWGGMTESAVAPFAAILDKDSTIYFVGKVGREDIDEVRKFFKENYPIVDASGISINPTGTDHHYCGEDFAKIKLRVEPTTYEQIEPYIHKSDVVIFNFGNVDDIDPEAIKKVRENSKAFIYVDVHRKPFAAGEDGYIYSRGWPDWEKYLQYADTVQMNKSECAALFRKEIKTLDDLVDCAKKILDVGAKQVILTRGSEGALLAYRAPSYKFVLVPAVPIQAIDTAGSGDAFAAGYLTSLHEGKSSVEAGKFGSLMSAINCEFKGYMKNITREMIEKRMPVDFNHILYNPKRSSS